MLAPPIAITKIRPTAPGANQIASSSLVFVAGIIDENGIPRNLRATTATDAKSQAAVSALAQWVFQPAHLNGNPVASKVLIGLSVAPAPAPNVGK